MNEYSIFHWIKKEDGTVSFPEFSLAAPEFTDSRLWHQLNCLNLSDAAPKELSLRMNTVLAQESFRLEITENRVTVLASSSCGCYYGLAALKLLLSVNRGTLPLGVIESTPDFRNRGVMLDVSRGKMPTLSYLKNLVSVISDLKYNILQLYCEDKLALEGHPLIGTLTGAYTQAQIRELDEWCADHFVQLQPCIQTYSHMHGLLRLPGYSHLAENNDLFSFAAGKEAVYDFLADEFRQVLPWFSCKTLNINMDEAYDIGTDYSREAVKALGTGQVFVNHIQRVIKAARKAGAKTIQLWGDIVQKYAELIPQLPDDVIVMVWNYNPLPKFDALPVFRDTGREFWAAGGVGTWNGIFPRTYNAYINLSNLSVQAHEMGANGFLVTDWGDYGHMQPLGLSLYGYVIGALQADSAMARSGDELEKAIWPLILGDEQLEKGFRALMDSNLAENLKTDFKTMSIYYFFDDMLDGLSMRGNENYARLTEKTFRELLRCGSEAVCALTGKISPRRFPDQNWEALFGADYLAELRLSARMTQFIGQKGILACRIREALRDPSLTPDGVMALILEVHALYDEFCLIRREFENCWLLRAEHKGIQTSLSLFDHAGVQMAQTVRYLAAQREALLHGDPVDADLTGYSGRNYEVLWTADFKNMWDRAYPWR